MADFKWNDEDSASYIAMLVDLEADTSAMIKKAVYPAADIIADEIKEGIKALPVLKPGHYFGTPSNPIDGVTSAQKEGLLDGFGIAKFQQENGGWNVRAGFAGYNNTKTSDNTGYQPNVLIARSVESGTSFRKKHPFVAPAVRRAKDRAKKAMQESLDQSIEETKEKHGIK